MPYIPVISNLLMKNLPSFIFTFQYSSLLLGKTLHLTREPAMLLPECLLLSLEFQLDWRILSFNSRTTTRRSSALAPSFFLIAEEVLSRGLIELQVRGKTKPFHVPRGCPSISHFLFADDTLILTNVTKQSLNNLMKFLNRYEKASGQRRKELLCLREACGT